MELDPEVPVDQKEQQQEQQPSRPQQRVGQGGHGSPTSILRVSESPKKLTPLKWIDSWKETAASFIVQGSVNPQDVAEHIPTPGPAADEAAMEQVEAQRALVPQPGAAFIAVMPHPPVHKYRTRATVEDAEVKHNPHEGILGRDPPTISSTSNKQRLKKKR